MKNQIHNLSHLFLSVTLSLAVTHCGKTNFDKGSVASGNAAVVQTPSSNDRDVEENDQEAMVASEPVSVGGAFLACTLATAQSTSEEAAVQCEFSSRDVGSRQAQDLLYGFSTGANRAQASALVPAREEFINDGARQVWVWHFYFQKSGIQDGWIYVDIQDRARTSDAIIKSDVAISTATPAPAPTPTPTATPTTATAPSMFRFNSGAQKLGDDGAGVAVEAGCVGIDNVNIAMARSRSYAVTFTTETSLNIVFSNLCGVGTGATNTDGSFTTATLRDANNGAVFKFTLASQAKLTYTSAKIPAGIYSLVISPASRNGALNDFAYSDLMIEGAGITVK